MRPGRAGYDLAINYRRSLRAARGSVVNAASIARLRPGPQPLAYAASKAAVVRLTRTLSRVLAPEVRVNAVAPGWIAGERMQRRSARTTAG